MKINLDEISILISNVRTIKLANFVGVSRNMAEKYKNFSSLPPLDKAILIEDEFGIPARAWVELKKNKEAEK